MLVFFYFFSLKHKAQKKDYIDSLLYQDTIIRISLLSMFYYYTIITLLLLRTNLHTIKPIFSFAFSFCTFSYIPIVNPPYLPINLFTHHHYRRGSFNLSQYCFAVLLPHKKSRCFASTSFLLRSLIFTTTKNIYNINLHVKSF